MPLLFSMSDVLRDLPAPGRCAGSSGSKSVTVPDTSHAGTRSSHNRNTLEEGI